MIVKVRVRLHKPEGEEICEGVLSNEEEGEKYGCELLIDGVRWLGRYEVLDVLH